MQFSVKSSKDGVRAKPKPAKKIHNDSHLHNANRPGQFKTSHKSNEMPVKFRFEQSGNNLSQMCSFKNALGMELWDLSLKPWPTSWIHAWRQEQTQTENCRFRFQIILQTRLPHQDTQEALTRMLVGKEKLWMLQQLSNPFISCFLLLPWKKLHWCCMFSAQQLLNEVHEVQVCSQGLVLSEKSDAINLVATWAQDKEALSTFFKNQKEEDKPLLSISNDALQVSQWNFQKFHQT